MCPENKGIHSYAVAGKHHEKKPLSKDSVRLKKKVGRTKVAQVHLGTDPRSVVSDRSKTTIWVREKKFIYELLSNPEYVMSFSKAMLLTVVEFQDTQCRMPKE